MVIHTPWLLIMQLPFSQKNFKPGVETKELLIFLKHPITPATNGAAERLVQTFKQALKKSSLPPRRTLQEFLIKYKRTPNTSGYHISSIKRRP